MPVCGPPPKRAGPCASFRCGAATLRRCLPSLPSALAQAALPSLPSALAQPALPCLRLVKHLADYVLVWSGGGGDDLAKSPHMARIGTSVFTDICGLRDTQCHSFGFINNQGEPHAHADDGPMAPSLEHSPPPFHSTPGTASPPNALLPVRRVRCANPRRRHAHAHDGGVHAVQDDHERPRAGRGGEPNLLSGGESDTATCPLLSRKSAQ